MCGRCAKSYDRTAHRDGSVIEAMAWAARRARRFASPRTVKPIYPTTDFVMGSLSPYMREQLSLDQRSASERLRARAPRMEHVKRKGERRLCHRPDEHDAGCTCKPRRK